MDQNDFSTDGSLNQNASVSSHQFGSKQPSSHWKTENGAYEGKVSKSTNILKAKQSIIGNTGVNIPSGSAFNQAYASNQVQGSRQGM